MQIRCKEVASCKSFHLPTRSKLIGSILSCKWSIQARVVKFMPAYDFTLECKQCIAQSGRLTVSYHQSTPITAHDASSGKSSYHRKLFSGCITDRLAEVH